MDGRCPFVLDTTGRDVHAEGVHLREEQGPVALVELPQGVKAWVVLSYDVATKLLTDPRISKDPRANWPAYINGEIRPDWPLATWVAMENMITADGRDHERLRKPVLKSFTPHRVRTMQPFIEKAVADLLDELAALPPGEAIDLKRIFCYRLPTTIICDLFGIPEAGRDELLRGGERNTDSNMSPEEAEANVLLWQRQFLELIETKRRTPGDDMTSDLIAASDADGAALSDAELAGTVFLMLGAGSETVMNLLTHSVFQLLQNPDQRALVESGQVSWEDVIEESLRVESPINMIPLRFAIEDIELDGVTIRQGDAMLIGFAAIGRDPDLHGPTADRWDITRPDKKHLSFGYGAHFCLGAPLARLEAQIALPALFNRFPDLALAIPPDELEPQGTFIMNGWKTLPIYLKGTS